MAGHPLADLRVRPDRHLLRCPHGRAVAAQLAVSQERRYQAVPGSGADRAEAFLTASGDWLRNWKVGEPATREDSVEVTVTGTALSPHPRGRVVRLTDRPRHSGAIHGSGTMSRQQGSVSVELAILTPRLPPVDGARHRQWPYGGGVQCGRPRRPRRRTDGLPQPRRRDRPGPGHGRCPDTLAHQGRLLRRHPRWRASSSP